MQKRTQLLILIVVALALLIFGVWYLLAPIIKTAQQPPALPTNVIPSSTNIPNKPTNPTVNTQSSSTPAEAPLPQGVKQVENTASNVVSRLGSGTNREGFQGYSDATLDATSSFQQELVKEQKAMQQAHPSTGPAYGILTRVVKPDASQAVDQAATMTITVTVQQSEDAGQPSHPTRITNREAIVSFERQTNGNYLVNGIVWKDITL